MSSYHLEGFAIGACGCDSAISCLCSNAAEPQAPANGCSSLVAYRIVQGTVNNNDVSGCVIVRILREDAEFLYLDIETAPPIQTLLIRAFTGKLGGILQQLAQLSQVERTIRLAPIQFQEQRDRVTLTIGDRVIRQGIRQTKFCFTL